MPWELEEAEVIEALCQRYHCLPSQVLAEDVSILQHVAILAEAHPPEEQPQVPEL